MFGFRRAKDETDEFTRIREAVRVDQQQPTPGAGMVPPPPAPPPGYGVAPQAPEGEAAWLRPAQPAPNPYAMPPGQPAMAPPQAMAAPAANGTVIYLDASFDGRLQSEGSIHVQGKVKGEIRAGDTVYIAREARVEASIRATNVTVAGEVVGDITCTGRLEVIPTGRVSGEVDAGKLVIHEGAFINSAFKMATDGARQDARPRSSGIGGQP